MSVDVVANGAVPRAAEVLTPAAVDLVAELERAFGPERRRLLRRRAERRREVAAGAPLGFADATREVREASWQVAPAPKDLTNRRVEITGPTERKMAINALNSGANVWLADFEDALAPTWRNVIDGQLNLMDAIRGDLSFTSPDGRDYRVTAARPPVIVARPRGWHLDDWHVRVDSRPVAAAFVDFGLYVFHNATELVERGSGPYFYLPKLESHLEARLWSQIFTSTEERLGLPPGTIRATVLVETFPAAFEMDEILFELRQHITGLNAGRWDYLFSLIKTFRDGGPGYVLPDRNTVSMTAPFMRHYTELLVSTCHARGAHAIGGMAAFVPNRRDEEVTRVALDKVRADKDREARDGFDGSWVAHPDLVDVCRTAFDEVLGERPNQLDRLRPDVVVGAADLADLGSLDRRVTWDGLRNNVSVTLRYVEAWLRGTGAVALYNLMEDLATAEIARAQIWQWVRNGVTLDDGTVVTRDLVSGCVDDELAGVDDAAGVGRWGEARDVFDRVALADDFPSFITDVAYPRLVWRP